MNVSNNAKGVFLACLGVIVLSPDSLLIRFIDVDLWTLMFLRGIFIAICMFVLSLLINKSASLQQYTGLDKYAWGIVVMMSISSFFFVGSIQTTSVAHTLIIVGAAPVVAALLGLFFLHERVPMHTWVTIVVVVIGLVFVVYDDQQSSLLGDFYALVACLLWSINFILARLTRMKNMLSAMAVSGLMMAVMAYPLASIESLSMQQFLLALLLGFMVGSAFSLITLAPRFIPAAEVAVFMPLESVFGGLLVWWFIGEFPGLISLVAGIIIILAIMLNSYFQLKDSTS